MFANKKIPFFIFKRPPMDGSTGNRKQDILFLGQSCGGMKSWYLSLVKWVKFDYGHFLIHYLYAVIKQYLVNDRILVKYCPGWGFFFKNLQICNNITYICGAKHTIIPQLFSNLFSLWLFEVTEDNSASLSYKPLYSCSSKAWRSTSYQSN